MANSGTYSFNPPLGSLAQNALARCRVQRTAIAAQHMNDAYLETNFQQIEWVNDGITLWTVDLITAPLTQGVATYTVPANTVMILDLYITIPGQTNRLIYPFSRTDYASLANPLQQGVPTSFWYDRILTPTITLWPVPDGNGPYTASYYRYRQVQDGNLAQGGNAEIPYLGLDAFGAGLAWRLSRIYAQDLEQTRKSDYDFAYGKMAKQITENVPLYITPGLAGYYR